MNAINKLKLLKNNVEKIQKLNEDLMDTHLAKNNKIEGLDDFLLGPTALAISYDEPTVPAKVIKKFAKTHQKPEVKGI